MSTSRYSSLLHRTASRHARLFFVLGALAVLMHILTGMGLMGLHQGKLDSSGNFVAEICTVLGVGKAQATLGNISNIKINIAGDSSPSDSRNPRDCCQLCVTSSPLLFASMPLAVSPAPTFHASLAAFISARPASFAWTAHSPRGPPALG